MLITAAIEEKYMGSKLLFRDLNFNVQENSKIGLIGRNGAGKTTLFHLLTGEDADFSGVIERKRDLVVIATAQEHFLDEPYSTLDYVLKFVPDYYELQEKLETFPQTMGENIELIHEYTNALQTFTERGYYTVEEEIIEALKNFDIDSATAHRPLSSLSGGQKRFVELVKVRFSRAELILLDEPTNHLDYHGKELFIRWLRSIKVAVCIISHDRDVLHEVNTIAELKDSTIFVYPGEYQAYIRQNGDSTVTQIAQYEAATKRLAILKKQITAARVRQGQVGDNAPKILAERLTREYDALQTSLKKPSFWIDKDTVDLLSDKVTERYDRYKARSINLKAGIADRFEHQLLKVEKLSIGYEAPLFKEISFELAHGDRLQIKGRNGAGKSTLIRVLLASIAGKKSEATLFDGSIMANGKLRVGVYEQEVGSEYLHMPLGKAIENVHHTAGLSCTPQELKTLLARFLFDPMRDQSLTIDKLSGGQKARFQLIRMLCTNPNLLILDEPTNHLDLPSIEELEQTLIDFSGAILYVSHDSYFVEKMAGELRHIGKE